MTAKIIDGNEVSSLIKARIKEQVSKMKIKPGLAAILIGNNKSSHIYISHKQKACEEVGIYSVRKLLPDNIDEEKLLKIIDELDQDKKIHGIIVQLPLPKHLSSHLIINYIKPEKDVDGFSDINLGRLMSGNNLIVPSTPKGIIRLLEHHKISLDGKHAVVVGRSPIVGKPISLLLQQKNCTVTMCHSKSKPLEKYTKDADILIVAAGKPNLIKANMVKKGAVVIDVGINRVNNKLVGDVDFESVKKVASYITPVPGGVGPVTVAMLMENTIECMKLSGTF